MNAQRKLAALVATTALLVGSLAMAGGVFATTGPGEFDWNLVNGVNAAGCDEDTGDASMLWIFTGGDAISNVVFHGPTGDFNMTQPGGAGSAWKTQPDFVDYFDPTSVSAGDVYVTYDGTLAKHHVTLTLSHCTGEQTGTSASAITSQVKDGAGVTIDNENPAFGTVTAHDTAEVTITGDTTSAPAGSHVQFFFWNNNNTCDGEPSASSDQMDVSGDPSVINVDGSPFAQGPLGPGEYSFQAIFTSGDEAAVDSATGDCEPFVVLTQSTSGTTTTFPESSTFGNTTDPTDHSWMLIAALGVFLGSLLVLAPARAKSRR